MRVIDRVTDYAEKVVSDEIKAGNLVKLACKRHLKDLERSKLAPYLYKFDVEKAQENIDFFESLRFTDGGEDLVGKQIELLSFQDFIIGSLFGWIHKVTGFRKYRKSYVQLARKNAKSLLNSGIGIKMAGFDNHENAQVYCVATKMDQAKIVWGQAKKFIEKEPDLEDIFHIRDYSSEIESKLNGGVIKALGRDTKSIDGFDPHCGIVDEYHLHKTNQMIKLLEDGSVNQEQSLISIITTAGFDLNTPCYEEYEYCKNLLETSIGEDNEHYFIYIAQMDKEDNIWDSNNWIKANPLVATLEHGMDNLKRFAKESKEKGGHDLVNFLTKSLNIWYQFTDNQYMNIEKWNECGTDLSLEDFKGYNCIVGLDLSSGGDLTSLNIEIPYIEDGENKYFIHSHSFVPKNRVSEHIKTDKAPYDLWINQELLTATETLSGIKTDYKYIISYLKKILDRYELNLTAIAYDPHNANIFLSDLEDFGVDLIEIRQSARNLSDATEDFKLEVDAGNITYNKNNKLLTWSMANAKTESNSFGEIKLIKQDRYNRIDPVDAVIDSHKIAMQQKEDPVDLDDYATDEYLDSIGW